MKKLVGAATIVVELFKICDLRGLGLILLGYSMSVDLGSFGGSQRFKSPSDVLCALST